MCSRPARAPTLSPRSLQEKQGKYPCVRLENLSHFWRRATQCLLGGVEVDAIDATLYTPLDAVDATLGRLRANTRGDGVRGPNYRIRSLSRFAQCVWTSKMECAVIMPEAATAGTPMPGNVESPQT